MNLSNFGLEFVAARCDQGKTVEMRIKLKCSGILSGVPVDVFGDNITVYMDLSILPRPNLTTEE